MSIEQLTSALKVTRDGNYNAIEAAVAVEQELLNAHEEIERLKQVPVPVPPVLSVLETTPTTVLLEVTGTDRGIVWYWPTHGNPEQVPEHAPKPVNFRLTGDGPVTVLIEGLNPRWKMSAAVEVAGIASNEVTWDQPALIVEDKPVDPPPVIEVTDPIYTAPPSNAILCETVETARQMFVKNRNNKLPLLVRIPGELRGVGLRLENGNENVWFEDMTFMDGSGSHTACPISFPNGVQRVHVNRCKFIRCGQGIFVYDPHFCTFVGNYAADGGQFLGILWNNSNRPCRDTRIEHNIMERLKGHDMELRTEHPQRWAWDGKVPTIIGARKRYNRSIGSPTLPVRSMAFSDATGHAKDCLCEFEYTEGSEWSKEVMNGWTYRNCTAVDCDVMFAIAAKATDVNISTGNRMIRVREYAIGYGHDGQPGGLKNYWKIAPPVT